MAKKKKDDNVPSLLSPINIYQNIILYEFNLFRYPLFFVNKRAEGQQKMIEVKLSTSAGEGFWRVSPSMDSGAGGPFEDLTLMVLNKLINELPKPVTNPIDIGSLNKIAFVMGYKTSRGGWVNERIKLAIRRMTSLTITSKFAFYDKNKSKYLAGSDGVFHLLERCLFVNEEDGNGKKAESNFIWLNDTLLTSINKKYVSPVDIDFYFELNSTSRALFKLLQISFFASKNTNTPTNFKYSTICDRTTIGKRNHLGLAKQQLDPSHEELLKKRFLKSYEWTNMSGVKNNWMITYWPGELAERYTSHHIPKSGSAAPFIDNERCFADPVIDIGINDQAKPISLFDAAEEASHINPITANAGNIVEFYVNEFLKRYENKPQISKARDEKIIKDLLESYSEEDIRSLVVIFLDTTDNEYIRNSGYTLSVFKTVINNLLIKLNVEKQAAKVKSKGRAGKRDVDRMSPDEIKEDIDKIIKS